MKKIKIMLEYRCYPLWVYDASGELLCNDLIGEVEEVAELKALLDAVQAAGRGLWDGV